MIIKQKYFMYSVVVFLFIFFILLSACSPSVYYVSFSDKIEFETERNFLVSLFEENEDIVALSLQLMPENAESLSIYINFISFWENEFTAGNEHNQNEIIIISRNTFAPKIDPLLGMTNTTLENCLNGNETLVPVEEILPPFTALRVDGLAIDDENYPLIKLTGIKITAAENVKNTRTLSNKINLLSAILENAPKPLYQLTPQPLWITAGGDLMLDPEGVELFLREGPRAVFGGTADMLASSDLALVNLEGVISNRTTRVPKSFNFRFAPEIAPALRAVGIDAVLHANNHVFDYGEAAFLDSLNYLEQAGIGIAGAGINIEAASDPFVFQKKDKNVNVFGLASFPRERNGWDGVTAAALADRPGMLHAQRGGAEKLKEKFCEDSLNIVLFHGGIEMSLRPDRATRELYTGLVEAGADLVIGSHPHTVQGFEWVHGKSVFWSLGNYVFTGKANMDGYEEGLFIRLGFLDGRMLYMEPFALILTHTHSEIAPPEALETFYRRSRELLVVSF